MSNWLIVGLGNPGERYEKTRHNLGFMVVDLLANRLQTSVKREECRALVGRGLIENQRLELVKPQTFMNLSGEAVKCLLGKDARSEAKIIVIVDDLALPFGTIRLRAKGSSGGHNGLKSIENCLRTQEFFRLRIGIKPELELSDTKNFVLENFTRDEIAELKNILEKCADAVSAVISDGIEKAMARWNAE